MEDPTTLTLNLTYLGTLGVAGFMFLLLGFLVVITLVIAGIARLVSIILLAMVGVFPKRDTVPIVHLPPTPSWFPDPDSADPDSPDPDSAPGVGGPELVPVADLPTADLPTAAGSPAVGSPAVVPAAAAVVVSVPPRRRFFKTHVFTAAGRRIAAMWAAVRSIAWWKSTFDPHRLPKPAQIMAWAQRTAATVFVSQGKRHPFVAALTREPPVLSEKWAAAVAQADERAAARAKAAALPEIVVTVREVAPSSQVETAPGEKASQGPPSNGLSTHGPSANRKTPQGGSTKGSPPQPVRGGSLTPAAGARPRA